MVQFGPTVAVTVRFAVALPAESDRAEPITTAPLITRLKKSFDVLMVAIFFPSRFRW
jgi:hypothetical protein